MNPILRELGFSPSDRVAVVHADDIGMCHSTLPALEELFAFGLVTSASVMVPCPWFPAVAAWKQRNSDVDVGVHLTLTSEWDRYRWAPISTRSPDSGLIDEQGYFHRTTAAFHQHAAREAVRDEMAAQLDRAAQLGLAPTHVDCHMLAALHDPFFEDYLQIGFSRGMPAFLPRRHDHAGRGQDRLQERADLWEKRGMPVFDCYAVATQRPYVNDQNAFVRELFSRLPSGLSCVLLHPATDSDELRSVTDEWKGRVADFEAFRDPSLRDYVQDLGIQLISYRPLRAATAARVREFNSAQVRQRAALPPDVT